MKCRLNNGICINCSSSGLEECYAEVDIEELIKIERGEIPVRCVKITSTQMDILKAPCSHRGEALRTTQCESCGGNCQIKIFHCEIFKECTISKDVGLPTCSGCKERRYL